MRVHIKEQLYIHSYTNIYAYRTGKTQICHTLCVNVQKPLDQGTATSLLPSTFPLNFLLFPAYFPFIFPSF